MADHFFINIDSRNKTYGSNTNFSVGFASFNLEPGVSCAVSLDSAQFFNLEYPINSTNNTIVFQEADDTGTSYTATLTEGNYSGAEIATEIASKMTAATGNAYTYTCSYSDSTGKLTIAGLILPDTFRITSINEIYGFDAMTSFVVTKTADNPAILSGPEYVDLVIPSLISGNLTSNENGNGIVKRIPLSLSWGSLITYQQSESEQSIIVNKEYLDSLVLRLKRPDGNDYQLPDNAHLSVVLKCSYQL